MSNGNLPFLLLSYKQLRLIPGLLGIAMPIILVVWGFFLCECIDIQDSISDYYSLRTRDSLVGILLAVGVFLFTYKGYEREKVPAFGQNHGPVGVPVRHWRGLFPQHRRRLGTNGAFHIRGRLVHHAGDILYVPFHQRQTGRAPYAQEEVTKQDLRGSGIVIVACIGLMLVNGFFLDDTSLEDIKPVFWLESLALWAFEASWLVKGEALFKD